MASLIADCPRCGAQHTTFSVDGVNFLKQDYGWQNWFEAFSICRNCLRSTIFVLAGDVNSDTELREKNPLEIKSVSLNNAFKVKTFISLKDAAHQEAPAHVPKDIALAFDEAATCLSTQCWNASGAMFRLCLDLATRPMLPKEEIQGLNEKTRRDLGLRLAWLFENDKLPSSLRELSKCVHQDGNDAAHAGSLTREDAEDLLDFATRFLERIFTEPERLRLAEIRREERRRPKE